MNTITTTYTQLTAALTSDSLLLASTVTGFDPFWDDFGGEIDYEADSLAVTYENCTTSAELKLRSPMLRDRPQLECKAMSLRGFPAKSLQFPLSLPCQ